jgi:CDP-diglyceride synthetase
MDEKELTLLDRLSKNVEKLASHFEKANIKDYLSYAGNPWKVLMTNLLAGIMRGFGLAIGMTVILAVIMIIVTKILSHLITLPFVGQQVAQLVELVNSYMKEGTKIKLDSGGM